MMLLVVGLSHRTAPVSLRERAVLDEEALNCSLETLVEKVEGVEEAVLLSTCNRFEIYIATGSEISGVQRSDVQSSDVQRRRILAFLSDQLAIPETELESHLYCYQGDACLRHLMRVAAGLDSLVLGEEQILGQTRTALAAATGAGSAGPWLTRLFQQAIHAGKRARTETEISRHATSVSHAAVQLADRHISDMGSARLLIVGAGDMAQIAMRVLDRRQVGALGCINRTLERAEEMVANYGGRAFGWGQLAEALIWADVVIVATGAPHPVIHREDVAPILPLRDKSTLLLIDISLPRNVELSVDELPEVIRYDIDQLQATLDANLAQRQAAIPAVETILDEEIKRLQSWMQGRALAPAIVTMRKQVETIARSELDAALGMLAHLDENDRAVLEKMMRRVVNKVLHRPTVQLKSLSASYPELSTAEIAQRLFSPIEEEGARPVDLANRQLQSVPGD